MYSKQGQRGQIAPFIQINYSLAQRTPIPVVIRNLSDNFIVFGNTVNVLI